MSVEPGPKEPIIDWGRALGGALAAVSSAVVLSTLGAAGTIIGAAVGSLVVTLGTSVYANGIKRSREKMALAQAAARRRMVTGQAGTRRAAGGTADDIAVIGPLVDPVIDPATASANAATAADPVAGAGSMTWRERLAGMPWKRVLIAAVATFVAAMVAITVFELIAHRSVASFTGGTSEKDGTTWHHPRESTTPTPSSKPSTTSTPSGAASASSTPSSTPSATATPSSASSATSTPSSEPTGTPTATDTPTSGAAGAGNGVQ